MKPILGFLILLLISTVAWGGEFQKPYFAATPQGAWAEYLLTSQDGAKSSFVYEREKDDDGRVVLEIRCRILAGPGKDSKSKSLYVMPRGFDLERKGLSYGRYAEAMSMNAGGADMPVDEATLKVIREGSKDFGGAVTHEGSEKIEGRNCDRYAYSIKLGGAMPMVENGKLWLDASVPFAVVRQSGKITQEDGTVVSEYEMRLQETGLNQLVAEAAAPRATPAPVKPAVPVKAGLAEGFKAGQVGLEVEAVAGSGGRKLQIILLNKTEAELTVAVPSGDLDVEGDSPVGILRITIPKSAAVVMPAGEKSKSLSVAQRGARGIVAGRCSLSVYEGTPLFSGSVTVDSLSK